MKLTQTDWLILILLSACTCGLYARTSRFDFIHYDDPDYVIENERVRGGLRIENMHWACTTFAVANWHPLTWLSLMLDVQLMGHRAGAFHLTNTALHMGNTLLLFLLLRAMTQARWRSALVAALFAVHPLHVESVAWIAERKDVLSTFFGFAAMLAYVRYTRVGSIAAFLLVIVAFAMSLLAKPMFVTLPFVLLLLDYWPLQRLGKVLPSRLILEKCPLLALSIASSIVTTLAQESGGAMTRLHVLPLGTRLGNAAVSYVCYIIDTVWPARLAILYPFPKQRPVETIILSAIVLIVVTALVVRAGSRHRHLPVGWFWYLGTLVPVIGIVAVGEQARADRYTYVPLIGLFVMLAWSIPTLRSRGATAIVGIAAAVICIALSVRTWQQLGKWRNSETLFAHALSVVGPHPTLYVNCGVTMAARKNYTEAARYFRQALELNPRHWRALNNFADSLAREGKLDEAIEYYRRAIEIKPSLAILHYNLGTTLAEQGRLIEAEASLRDAVRLRPDMTAARENLSAVLAAQGKAR